MAKTPLEKIKSAKHDQVKRWIVSALRRLDSGACLQSSLVGHICVMLEAKNLSGNPKQEFITKINKAIGALLLENPPKIKRSNSKRVSLLKHKKRKCIETISKCGFDAASQAHRIAETIKQAIETDELEEVVALLVQALDPDSSKRLLEALFEEAASDRGIGI